MKNAELRGRIGKNFLKWKKEELQKDVPENKRRKRTKRERNLPRRNREEEKRTQR